MIHPTKLISASLLCLSFGAGALIAEDASSKRLACLAMETADLVPDGVSCMEDYASASEAAVQRLAPAYQAYFSGIVAQVGKSAPVGYGSIEPSAMAFMDILAGTAIELPTSAYPLDRRSVHLDNIVLVDQSFLVGEPSFALRTFDRPMDQTRIYEITAAGYHAWDDVVVGCLALTSDIEPCAGTAYFSVHKTGQMSAEADIDHVQIDPLSLSQSRKVLTAILSEEGGIEMEPARRHAAMVEAIASLADLLD